MRPSIGVQLINDGTNYILKGPNGAKLMAIKISDNQLLVQAGVDTDETI